MNKKTRKFLVLLLILSLLSTFLLTACAPQESQENENTPPQSSEAEPELPVVEKAENQITSFETYDEIAQMRLLNNFGKAVMSKEHATHGNQSLQVSINGNYTIKANPLLAILTGTEFLEKTNYLDVDKFYLDVYNANDTEQTVYTSYLTKRGGGSISSSETACTIGAKQSVTLTFQLNRDLMNYFIDLKNVLQVRLSFDCATEYNQPYRVFYLDNFRYSVTSQPVNKDIKVREDSEIESCEKADYLAAWTNINNYIYAPSTLKYNTDSRYVKEGNASFCVTNVPNWGTTGTGPTYNVGWKISPKVADMREYYSYSFWIYNDWHEELMLRASYHYSFGVNYPAQGSEQIALKANDWTYVEITTEYLMENGVDPTYFNWLSISVLVPRTQSCSFYFDAIYLNNTPGEHKDF